MGVGLLTLQQLYFTAIMLLCLDVILSHLLIRTSNILPCLLPILSLLLSDLHGHGCQSIHPLSTWSSLPFLHPHSTPNVLP